MNEYQYSTVVLRIPSSEHQNPIMFTYRGTSWGEWPRKSRQKPTRCADLHGWHLSLFLACFVSNNMKFKCIVEHRYRTYDWLGVISVRHTPWLKKKVRIINGTIRYITMKSAYPIHRYMFKNLGNLGNSKICGGPCSLTLFLYWSRCKKTNHFTTNDVIKCIQMIFD